MRVERLIQAGRGLMLAAIVGAPALSLAQQDTTVRVDARWLPFTGCWASYVSGTRGPDVCVIPTTDSNAVELIGLAHDSVVSRETVTAAEARERSGANECVGFESARWSLDDRRMYAFASYKCRVTGRRQWTSLYSMNSPTTFSRIESFTNDAGMSLRTINFVALDTTPQLPAALRARLPHASRRSMRAAARTVASTELSTADVADAVSSFHPRLIAEWLYDRNEPFALSRPDRRGLREAGFPVEVIEAMQSISSPRRAAREREKNLAAGSSVALGKAPRTRTSPPPAAGAAGAASCAVFSHERGVGCPTYSPGGWKVDETFAPVPIQPGLKPADYVIPLPRP